MFENPNEAVVKVVVRGDWAVVLACGERARKLLAEEIGRAVPVIMRSLGNWRGYDEQYQVFVEVNNEQNQ